MALAGGNQQLDVIGDEAKLVHRLFAVAVRAIFESATHGHNIADTKLHTEVAGLAERVELKPLAAAGFAITFDLHNGALT